MTLTRHLLILWLLARRVTRLVSAASHPEGTAEEGATGICRASSGGIHWFLFFLRFI